MTTAPSPTPKSLKTRLLNSLRLTLFSLLPEPWLLALGGGRRSNEWRAKLLPNHDQFIRPTRRQASRRRIAYELDLSELVDWHVYFDVDGSFRDSLFGLAREGDVVVDVGVNIGETAMNFARIVGPSGAVLGFEPDPVTFLRARTNLSLNSFPNLRLENIALGGEEGVVTLERVALGNSGMNRVTKLPPSTEAATVKMTTLDHFIRRADLSRIDLVKLDVEGYELEVIKGSQESLARFRPILFIEVDDRNLRRTGASASALLADLAARGYALTHAVTGKPVNARELPEAHFDVIARPA